MKLSRRTLLRGAGTVAIGLPFLSEMAPSPAYGAPGDVPARVLTFFFGLGVPVDFQADRYAAPFADHLGPLAAVADKIAFLRGVHYEKGSRTSGNHDRGSTTAFIGARESGASIDQVVLQHLHGDVSPTSVRTLCAGTFSRQDQNRRHIHSWVGAGMPTAQPIESPAQLFDRAFGTFMPEPAEVDEGAARRARYDRSVLDAAVRQYQHVTSDAFGLSADSKRRISLHLDKVRELERRIFDPDGPVMRPPSACAMERPPEYDHPELVEIQRTVNNEGVRMEVNRWMDFWKVMVDTYVLALQCDITRFGNLQFQSGGERIRLYGDYTAYGQTRSFSDDTTTHEYWHSWHRNDRYRALMLDHIWLIMTALTDYLRALDDPEVTDANGGTLLDNSLVLAGTELGDGDAHDIENVFHLSSTACGAIRPGVHNLDVQATQVYNAGLRALGIDGVSMDGEPSEAGEVASILV
ncbi:MAG: DUF1552 domain-containing protein [Myxococcota bacterium]